MSVPIFYFSENRKIGVCPYFSENRKIGVCPYFGENRKRGIMAEFKKIDGARRLLELGEDATLEEIKKSYRKLARKYHPDKCKGENKKECEEMSKRINHANDVLMAYCAGYKYSFREKDVKRNAMKRELYAHLKRFYDGWWGDLDL